MKTYHQQNLTALEMSKVEVNASMMVNHVGLKKKKKKFCFLYVQILYSVWASTVQTVMIFVCCWITYLTTTKLLYPTPAHWRQALENCKLFWV